MKYITLLAITCFGIHEAFSGEIDMYNLYDGEHEVNNERVRSFSIHSNGMRWIEEDHNFKEIFDKSCNSDAGGCMTITSTNGHQCHIPLSMLKKMNIDPVALGQNLIHDDHLNLSCHILRAVTSVLKSHLVYGLAKSILISNISNHVLNEEQEASEKRPRFFEFLSR